jgi:hypothetical protein
MLRTRSMKLAKYTNECFINYSIVCVGVIEVSIKDKIYEQNIIRTFY